MLDPCQLVGARAGSTKHSAEDVVRKLRRVDELAAEGKTGGAIRVRSAPWATCRHLTVLSPISTPAWIGTHLAASHRHTIDHGIDCLKIRYLVDAQFLAAVFSDQQRAEGVFTNRILFY